MALHRILTDIYLGGTEGWVSITTDVRQGVATSGGGITITRGRTSEGTVAAPGRADLVTDNRSGDYSPRNPLGTYYGLIGRNTPIRIGIELAVDAFDRTVSDGWGSTDAGQAWTVGATAADFDVASGSATIAHPTINFLRRAYWDTDLVDVEQVSDFSTSATTVGAALVVGHITRRDSAGSDCYWTRMEFNPDGSVAAKISKFINGSLTIVELATLADTGLTYTAGQPLRMRSACVDGRLSLRIWDPTGPEPAAWTLTATDTDLTGPGRAGIMTWVVSGNTNSPTLTVTIDNYAAIDRRAVMEVPGWPPRWNIPGTDVWTPIEAAGILRRLGQPGARPLESAPHRYLPTTSPVACWPLTDSVEAIEGAPLVGAYPMLPHRGSHPSGAVITYPQWGRGDLAPWLPPGLSRSGSAGLTVLRGDVAMPATTTWTVDLMFACGADIGDWTVDINPGYLLGTDAGGISSGWPQLQAWTDAQRLAVSMNGEPEVESDPLDCYDGRPHHVRWTASQSGGNVAWTVYLDGVAVTSGTTSGAMTLPPIIRMGLTADAVSGAQLVQEYVTVWTTPPALAGAVSAAFGHRGETAGARAARLADEEGVPIAVVGDPDDSEPMGPQGMEPLLRLIQQCADVDRAILGEQRETLGLALRLRASLYNQSPALEVDYSQRHLAPPLEPLGDDFEVTNDVTVSRPSGGSYQAVLESGPLSIQDPPDGIGAYPTTLELSVYGDWQLPHLAGWLRHLGTWDEERYPRVRINLAAEPWRSDAELTALAAALDSGRVLEISGLPDWMPPGPVRLMAQGDVETLDAFERDLVWSMEPADPYTVGVVEDPVLGRADTDGMELAADFDAGTDTSMSVTVTAGPAPILTSTHASMFDFDIQCGGVILTVTGISGSGPYTFTITQAPVNGVSKTIAAGTPLSLAHPWRVAL